MKSILKKLYRSNSLIRSASRKLSGNKKRVQGKDNKINTTNAYIKNVSIYIYGNNNEITIEENSNIANCKIYMRGNNHKLIIGESCVIKSGELWFEDEDCEITIGNKTTIEGAHIAVTEPKSKITIGEDCMLSSGIDIRSGDSHSIIDVDTNKRINQARNVSIGNRVWIGNKATILKGTTISDHSIVSAGAIVTRKFEDTNVILAGSPSEIIKSGITWDRKRIYS